MLVDVFAGAKTKILDDGILAVYDSSRDKWLSVERFQLRFALAHRDIQGDRYLKTVGETVSNMTGHRVLRDATITAIAAETRSTASGEFKIQSRTGVTVADVHSISLVTQKGKTDDLLDYDIDAGYELISIMTSGIVDAPVISVELAWRFDCPAIFDYDTFDGDDGDEPSKCVWVFENNEGLYRGSILSNEFVFAPPAGPTIVYANQMRTVHSYESNDFDVRFDWRVVSETAPTSSAHFLRLYVLNFVNQPVCHVGRWLDSSGIPQYFCAGQNPYTGPYWVANADASGKFRATRVGDDIFVYYWNDTLGQWEWNGNTSGQQMTGHAAASEPLSVRINFQQAKSLVGLDYRIDNFISL